MGGVQKVPKTVCYTQLSCIFTLPQSKIVCFFLIILFLVSLRLEKFKKKELNLFVAILGLCYCTGFSPVAASGGCCSWLWCVGISLRRPPLLQSSGSRTCGLQLLWGSKAQALQLWCTGLVVPQHVGSSQTRDPTLVSCTGRQISLPLSHQGKPQNRFLNCVLY